MRHDHVTGFVINMMVMVSYILCSHCKLSPIYQNKKRQRQLTGSS